MAYPSEKIAFETKQEPVLREPSLKHGSVEEDREVFKTGIDGVDFRTVTWQRAVIIFIKTQIATGVLGIPGALLSLGAVGGGLCVVGYQALNLYTTIVAGNFRNRHPECHTIVDMAGVVWGPIGREIIGVVFVLAFVLCTGSSLLGISIAFNALSDHGACSVLFTFVGMVMTIIFSSIRTWGKMTWPLLIGFVSVMAGVLVVVIGVTFNSRPAAAPPTGPYELGFYAIAYPSFASGITAACTIFVSSCGCPGYLPVIAEMKRPQDFKKAAYIVAVLVGAVYLSFSMVMYRWCGQWIASPSLGSAGPLLKKVAYGIALPSLIVSAGIFNHTSSKYLFVRMLRNTKHLQSNSLVHWSTWIGCNVSVCLLAFIMAEAIPVFNYILALLAALFLAPMSLICPAFFWMYDHKEYRSGPLSQKVVYGAHILLAALGTFMCIGGTYGAIVSIKNSYVPGSCFSCADNSNTVGV
ncbi:N amino acid transport system protein [Lachnellula occidentalis]|uniref:N amino acid transport system protein n=1 Tax=Lachnellula occidentalis TaxID=215460 RepID=A0A8H8RMF3_9HELO|nr:N amino acid transport system protein [Lachnellula occidentalis]